MDGRLDLRGYNFERDGPVELGGQWHLYWGRLLEPADFSSERAAEPSGLLRLPGVWNGHVVDSSVLSGEGAATFRLRVLTEPSAQPMALWVAEQTSCYRLWFDGKLVAENGVVALSSAAARPQALPRTPRVSLPGGSVEVVLQVANFEALYGGATHPVVLGSEAEIAHQRGRLRDLDLLLFGALIAMGLYHLGLFLLRRREKPALYIALVCLAFALRIPFLGLSGRPLTQLLPDLDWATAMKMVALPTRWGVAAILLYVASILPCRSTRVVARWAVIITVLMTVAAVLLPVRLGWLTVLPWQVAAVGAILFVLVVAVRAARQGNRVGWHLVFGWVLLGSVGLYEVAANVGGFKGTHLPIVPFGVFGFLLEQSWFVAFRLYSAFSAVEALSEELQQKNTVLRRLEVLKDEFLANTSHELRTPLHGIVGLSQSLLRGVAGPLPQAARESLKLMVASGRRLAALINDILDLSRLRRDDVKLELRPVDPRAVSSAVLSLLAPVAQAKGLRLVNDIDPGTPRVSADENRLHQILVNLVGNAIKSTETGQVRLSAGVHEQQLELRVTDTGVGIPHDRLAAIFERTEQVALPNVQVLPGAGLGLSIARRLVQLHGGAIQASSRLGEGSQFVVSLPLAPPEAAAHPSTTPLRESSRRDEYAEALYPAATACAAESAPDELPRAVMAGRAAEPSDSTPLCPLESAGQEPPTSPAALQGVNVLAVDDDAISLRVLQDQLRIAGANVRSASNGAEALRVAADSGHRFDLVLLDVMMPGLTGYEVTRLLRQQYQPSELPIILLTARGEQADQLRGFAAGANDYLVKPFFDEELVARSLLHVQLKRSFSVLAEKVALERELEAQRRSQELTGLRAERASLEKLRYQLNVHFLFNALASIRGAILSDARTAREMVSVLSEYCRLTLAHGAREVLPLAEELALARFFLRMYELRLQGRLQVEWQTDAALADFLVPAFIAQPLVENAVTHGGRTCGEETLQVRIVTAPDGERGLALSVSNLGTWVTAASAEASREATGLASVRRRLYRHFGDAARLEIQDASGWVHVRLRLPSPARPSLSVQQQSPQSARRTQSEVDSRRAQVLRPRGLA